ncbi:protein of unknown function [Arachidicoccus rhizosphaerae]|uniref:Chromosomal replication initiator DnaA C-terminal domain-containing protein n=1 Tax=Arachidicoccus rhizosphaerae TaxID=551991 RepID=A0A1H4CGE2_9BACT|nr:helix-turn-helix domain-containing protein [Arachidicoccus rhizosphaerae]SEA59495.1 protein of unknown function [Arachidicoccus rhizosphaerae]
MELIYIIGKRKGTPRNVFSEAEMQIRKMGWVAINPLEEILKFNEVDEEGLNSAEEESRFLIPFFNKCSGVYLLPGWESCQSARKEVAAADEASKRIMYQPQQVSIDDIIRAAEEVTGMSFDKIRARTRKGTIVEIRRAIFYLAWKYQSTTFVALAQMFGMDHTSVIHNRNTAKRLLSAGDERTTEVITQIKERLIA